MRAHSRRIALVAFAAAAVAAEIGLEFAGWHQSPATLEFAGVIVSAILISALAKHQSSAKDWAIMPPSFVIEFTALLLLGPNATMAVVVAGALTQTLFNAQKSHATRRTLLN